MRDHKGLNEIARIIRRDIVSMIHRAKSGHPGGSLSVVEILTALYFDEMNVDSSNPKMEDRDRFVLSKGHAAPALYATLAEKGYFDKEELNGFC
ncbi:transketolase, thiamine diphosphate binding domain protein [Clostridioides difficile DA00273]|nr:transketolase [Clostridioides difficile]EQH58191.1 transketolase, thiamine diphosphate binding domain protein [Clostridioides difficile DA00273]